MTRIFRIEPKIADTSSVDPLRPKFGFSQSKIRFLPGIASTSRKMNVLHLVAVPRVLHRDIAPGKNAIQLRHFSIAYIMPLCDTIGNKTIEDRSIWLHVKDVQNVHLEMRSARRIESPSSTFVPMYDFVWVVIPFYPRNRKSNIRRTCLFHWLKVHVAPYLTWCPKCGYFHIPHESVKTPSRVSNECRRPCDTAQRPRPLSSLGPFRIFFRDDHIYSL